MMVQIVDHILTELQEDLEKAKKEKEDAAARRKCDENQFNKLLAEMMETERIYISDLEEVRNCNYFILAPFSKSYYNSSIMFSSRCAKNLHRLHKKLEVATALIENLQEPKS